jgi:predicted MPP superfamily phosphohydrolase
MTERAAFLIRASHVGVGIISVLFILWIIMNREKYSYEQFFRLLMVFFGYFILVYVPKLSFILFQLIKDIVDLGFRIADKMRPQDLQVSEDVQRISRTDFLLRAGLIVSAIPFLSILHGIIRGRYNYKVNRVNLAFSNLPPAFDGVKIVQISDLHLGSFGDNTGQLEKAKEIINGLEADYILFTGDMVNNRAVEIKPFLALLKNLRAKRGKYSILGNHDYGTHFEWDNEEALKVNMEELFEYQNQAGFQLLKNDSVYLEKDGDRILLSGVENWGELPFPQYGDLDKAMEGMEDPGFKILMSHDPSHWDARVLQQKDFDLTLSGHTHGMQFAINIPGWKWSPVKLKYPRWSGLYQEGNQYLYVNIGLGFIAFPGRVGTPPEITEFVLHRKV